MPFNTGIALPTPIAEHPLAERVPTRKAMGLRRQHRLIKERVVALLSDGARLTRQEFVIRLGENDCGQGRLAIAVPKRILKRAVDRNRVKRVIKEAFRQHPVRTAPVDMLVTMHHQAATQAGDPNALKHQRQQLRATLMHLFSDILRRFGVAA